MAMTFLPLPVRPKARSGPVSALSPQPTIRQAAGHGYRLKVDFSHVWAAACGRSAQEADASRRDSLRNNSGRERRPALLRGLTSRHDGDRRFAIIIREQTL